MMHSTECLVKVHHLNDVLFVQRVQMYAKKIFFIPFRHWHPPARTINTMNRWIHNFKFFTGTTMTIPKQKSCLLQRFPGLLIVQFVWFLANSSPSFLFLSDMCYSECSSVIIARLVQVSTCCAVQITSSVCLRCKEWLLPLLLPFCQFEPIWLFPAEAFLQQATSAHRIVAHWIFFLFLAILFKP